MNRQHIFKFFIFLTLIISSNIFAQSTITIKDGDIVGGNTYNWTSNNTYILDGLVFVEEGAELHIEAGTIIKGKETPTTGDNTSALIITQGAKIYAEGTALRPIIFTAEIDDINNPNDLTSVDRGLWGGLILLGKARINTTSGIGQIEGIATEEPRGAYGGNDDNDNSGVLRYVSIRHGGSEIGAGNEINGLTMGAIGSGTTIEYVEVYSNLDDGYEWFGGTVNAKYLVSAFCGDDGFDYDEGYRGKNQYVFAMMGNDFAGRIAEQDGGTTPEDGQPYAIPLFYNATYIGPGVSAAPQGDGGQAMIFRDNAGGKYYNSIITDYNGATGGVAVTVEDLGSGEDSRARLEGGDLVLNNNIWWGFGAGSTVEAIVPQDFVRTHFTGNNNLIVDPQLNNISREQNGVLDPRPSASGPAASGAITPTDEFFDNVSYYGAFDPNALLWISGWTALYNDQFISSTITIKDGDIVGGNTYNWTSNNTYILDGLVFVEEGAELHIEAGTIIKGKETPTTGDNTSALIITQGAKIYAEGTALRPIIFTAEIDDINNPNDLTSVDRGLWGGLILLGKARINTTSGIGQIEGIATEEPRGAYGGNDDNDNSGVLRYVSIRHGGSEIGAGNEINGLTMGAIGSGTTIEYVEVYSNLDDGYEWFGGTVNAKYLVSAFCGDDGFDYDEGYRGKNQYVFAMMGNDFAGRIAEQDGGTTPEDGQPYAIPLFYNATYIGPGVSAAPQGDGGQAMIFRDNAGGKYYNSIITDYNGATGGVAVTVEDLGSGEDSRARLEGGDLVLNNNIWWGFGAGSTVEAIVPQDFVRTHFTGNNNLIVDPQLNNISREQNGVLDPRPSASGPAASGAITPTDEFFDNVSYYGAFEPDAPLWTANWTALSHDRFTDIKEENEISSLPTSFELSQNFPNPFNPSTTIRYSLPEAGFVKLVVYNMLGQEVETLINGFRNAGTYNIQWNASHLASGIYIYRLQSDNFVEMKKMILMK